MGTGFGTGRGVRCEEVYVPDGFLKSRIGRLAFARRIVVLNCVQERTYAHNQIHNNDGASAGKVEEAYRQVG